MINRKIYIKVSLINLSFLLVGVLMGVLFMEQRQTSIVHAQGDFEEVVPIMTVGSAGIGTLLANRIAADQVFVRDFDLLKIDEGILNLLSSKGYANSLEIQSIISSSKSAKPLRVKLPEPPKAIPEQKPKEGVPR